MNSSEIASRIVSGTDKREDPWRLFALCALSSIIMNEFEFDASFPSAMEPDDSDAARLVYAGFLWCPFDIFDGKARVPKQSLVAARMSFTGRSAGDPRALDSLLDGIRQLLRDGVIDNPKAAVNNRYWEYLTAAGGLAT